MLNSPFLRNYKPKYYMYSCIIIKIIEVFSMKHRVRVVVFNATFNNISVLSWRSVLLVEETGIPEENYRPADYTSP
jgi:hypothetical protein